MQVGHVVIGSVAPAYLAKGFRQNGFRWQLSRSPQPVLPTWPRRERWPTNGRQQAASHGKNQEDGQQATHREVSRTATAWYRGTGHLYPCGANCHLIMLAVYTSPLRRWLVAALIALMIGAPGVSGSASAQVPSVPTAGETYAVNTTADTVDADQGNPLCADAAGHCSLRAAIMQANFTTGPNTITVPSGVYLLTRTQPGNDDDVDVVGDLDVTGDLTIQGAGSGTTIVDGNGAVTHDRVFQILDTAVNVSLSNLTIRAGQQISNTFDEGGGLNWQGANGADLRLTNVVFENNQASYDGGLALNYSSSNATVDLENVTFHANRATAAVGGLGVAFGGDFDQFTLRNSRVYSNSAYEGGGLYFSGEIYPPGYASLEADAIYSNTAFLSAGLENHAGFATNPLLLVDSRLDDNDAGYYGGAIGNYGMLAILTTTLDANLASQAGGGVYNYEGGQVDLEQSTLSNNQAQFGGGLYSELFIHGSSVLTFTNSTVSDNIASRDGAGLYLVGGRGGLFNTTIADNHVQVPLTTTYAGLGGGIYISQTSIVQFQNTQIAGNFHQYQASRRCPTTAMDRWTRSGIT